MYACLFGALIKYDIQIHRTNCVMYNLILVSLHHV